MTFSSMSVTHAGRQPDAVIRPSDSIPGDEFGSAIASSGNTIIVAAPEHEGIGAAYVFRNLGGTWFQEAKLTSSRDSGPTQVTPTGFATAVAIDQAVVVVGETERSPIGRAYVFRRSGSTWTQDGVLEFPGNPSAQGLAVRGELIVVGAEFFDGESGVAYIFRNDGNAWIMTQTITSPNPYYSNRFGSAVAISDDCVAIGESSMGYSGAAGHVWVYARLSSGEIDTTNALRVFEGAVSFGSSLALYGSAAVVGAGRAHPNGWHITEGEAYLYSVDGTAWNTEPGMPLTTQYQAEFGNTVSLHDRRAAIGTWGAGIITYTYRDGAWAIEERLGSESSAGGGFGVSTALAANTLFIGAPASTESEGGMVGVYALQDPSVSIPAVSTWGITILTLSVLVAGTIIRGRIPLRGASCITR